MGSGWPMVLWRSNTSPPRVGHHPCADAISLLVPNIIHQLLFLQSTRLHALLAIDVCYNNASRTLRGPEQVQYAELEGKANFFPVHGSQAHAFKHAGSNWKDYLYHLLFCRTACHNSPWLYVQPQPHAIQ